MSDTPLKHCKKCDEDYPATTEFWYSSKRSKDGLGRPCKACRSAQQKAYRNQPGTKEKIYAQQKEYLNRAEVQEHRRAYLKDYGEIYNSRSDVKERKRVLAKKYYRQPDIREKKLTHLRKPEVRKRINSYRSRPEVREKNLAYCKEYHSRPNVKERHRSYEHTRNARKKSILGVHSPAQIKDQLRRQKYKCYYCQKRFQKANGKYIYHIEHTFPISRVAGTDIPANSIDYLVLSCPTCNLSKGDKFPWEWPEGGRLC